MNAHLTWPDLQLWIDLSEGFFVKKLSRNDCSWSEEASKHQTAIYVPVQVRKSKVFPKTLEPDDETPTTLVASYTGFWPATGEATQNEIRHYTPKGSETHLNGLPPEQFRDLTPASLIIGGRLRQAVQESTHWFAILDSRSAAASSLEAALDLQADFKSGVFSPADLILGARSGMDEVSHLVRLIRDAKASGQLEALIDSSRMPSPQLLAQEAQQEFLREIGRQSLNPFELEAPGDAIMRVSRDIEFRIYKRHEWRLRCAQIILAMGDGDDLVETMVRNYAAVDRIFLSAGQQRKTRAGLSFERHVARMLTDGKVRFEEQVILGGRRPDFILPDAEASRNQDDDAIVISCKTTLRERWKQVSREKFAGPIFLATVDDRVPVTTLDALKNEDITLVVPETLKRSKAAWYEKHSGVITFRDLFENQIAEKRPALLLDVRLV